MIVGGGFGAREFELKSEDDDAANAKERIDLSSISIAAAAAADSASACRGQIRPGSRKTSAAAAVRTLSGELRD